MERLKALKTNIEPFKPAILPLALWASLWVGLQSGDIEKIGSARPFLSEVQSLRAIVPLLAGLAGIIIISHHGYSRKPLGHLFFGPLTLMAVYGLVGVASVLNSPDSSVSLYWLGVYLSVPLVALAISSGANPLTHVSRLVKLNWIVALVAVPILIVVAFSVLHLDRIILEPSNLLECRLRSPFLGESWHDLTDGTLRSTGVGRYAAIAAILAFSGLWQGRGRLAWTLILVGAMLLLLTSGARTSFVGFGFAAALVIFLHGGWRAALAVSVGVAITVVILWSNGLDRPILESCFLSGYESGTSLLRIESPPAPATSDPLRPSTSEKTPEAVTGSIQIPPQAIMEPTQEPTQVPAHATIEPTLIPADATIEPTLIPAAIDPLQNTDIQEEEGSTGTLFGRVLIPSGLFTFSGRTVVWKAGWDELKKSPLLGYGFHGDRLILGTHMHNAMLHALFQTGWIGIIPFAGALIWVWVSLVRALTALLRLPKFHRNLLIQSAGILTFFTLRSIWESTWAFYGVDWLFLSIIFLYIQLINTELNKVYESAIPST